MPLKARDVKKSLREKFGFAPFTKGRDPDHEWLAVSAPGAARVAVMFSRGDTELGDPLLARICKQLKVTRPYLNGMIECSNSREAYVQKLAEAAKT